MTLDEAIIHAKELSESQLVGEDCREDHKQLAAWLEELKQYKLAGPYKKPAYKLTKFEKDLLQSCSNIYKYKFKAMPALIRMKEKGHFKDINEDATVKSILADCEVTEED